MGIRRGFVRVYVAEAVGRGGGKWLRPAATTRIDASARRKVNVRRSSLCCCVVRVSNRNFQAASTSDALPQTHPTSFCRARPASQLALAARAALLGLRVVWLWSGVRSRGASNNRRPPQSRLDALLDRD